MSATQKLKILYYIFNSTDNLAPVYVIPLTLEFDEVWKDFELLK